MGIATAAVLTLVSAIGAYAIDAIKEMPEQFQKTVERHEAKPHTGAVTQRELDQCMQNVNRRLDGLQTWMIKINDKLDK